MGRQRARDYDAKRAMIRDAAAKLFAEHGFDGSSVADLALRCGLTKPALYHYFPSKEALLYEILDTHIGMLRRMVLEADLEARELQALRIGQPDVLLVVDEDDVGRAHSAALLSWGCARTSSTTKRAPPPSARSRTRRPPKSLTML